MSLIKKFRAWQFRREWSAERQLARARVMMTEDAQWMAHDPKVAAVTERHLSLLADDWMHQALEDVANFRVRVGCCPHAARLEAAAKAASEISEYRIEQQHPSRPEVSKFYVSDRFTAQQYANIGWKVTALPAPKATQALKDVIAERERQVKVEGWNSGHDDAHGPGELATAASRYATNAAACMGAEPPTLKFGANWPWDESWFKPTTPRRDLVKAAALLLAEIERIDRTGAPS